MRLNDVVTLKAEVGRLDHVANGRVANTSAKGLLRSISEDERY